MLFDIILYAYPWWWRQYLITSPMANGLPLFGSHGLASDLYLLYHLLGRDYFFEGIIEGDCLIVLDYIHLYWLLSLGLPFHYLLQLFLFSGLLGSFFMDFLSQELVLDSDPLGERGRCNA